MKEYTQSDTRHGNCWQTAVACLLEVDPILLPPQCEIEALPKGVLDGWGAYSNVLNGYLSKHHGLIYFQIEEAQFGGVRPLHPYHVLIGPTERTAGHAANGRPNVHHCVVGKNGEMVWDVHPSRAGLLHTTAWGILGVEQECTRVNKASSSMYINHQALAFITRCLCPACGLEELRFKALRAIIELKETK